MLCCVVLRTAALMGRCAVYSKVRLSLCEIFVFMHLYIVKTQYYDVAIDFNMNILYNPA